MWKDVITGRRQALPGEPLMPGQWIYDGTGAITVQDARAIPGDVLLPGGDGRAGFGDYPHVACNQKLVWDDAAIRTMANVAGRLDAIRDADWPRWLEEPPVLPAINESLDETDIEREIAKKVVSFRQACVERRGGPVSVTEFIGMQARSSHGWTEAARGGCGVVSSR